MFKKKTLAESLAQVNSFIEELKSGINGHVKEIAEVRTEISGLVKKQTDLSHEIQNAERLIKVLSA